jgi:hypothetical protein
MGFVACTCGMFGVALFNQRGANMARLTGLFRRGSSYYIQVVLPANHPQQSISKNGKVVRSLGCLTYREALRQGTIRRAAILNNVSPDNLTLATPADTLDPPEVYLTKVHSHWKETKSRMNAMRSG